MRLKQLYQSEIREKLIEEFKTKNSMSVAQLTKIVINTGLGEALQNKKVIEHMSAQLASITGQKPQITLSKKDISSFKLRSGEPIGLKVTLRGQRMYDFLEKLVKIVLPRIRDFRGTSLSGFDRKGNYTLGLKEQTVFPEIEYSQIDKTRGLEITFVIRCIRRVEAKRLLELMGMPFSKEQQKFT